MKQYPDKVEIPKSLPSSYQSSDNKDVPIGQRCNNCKHYNTGYCSYWLAPVRADYWCASWASSYK